MQSKTLYAIAYFMKSFIDAHEESMTDEAHETLMSSYLTVLSAAKKAYKKEITKS